MASPMPAAHMSGWNNTPAAGEVDEYGLQTKFMNCTRLSPSLSLYRLCAMS
jgi:hypothetical protein